MASSVFYKFKSQRDESRVTFDGTGISVFDLKKEIILANNLGKANDFDLVLYDRSSNEEYKDDSQVIPRASSIIVKRVPTRPGKGKAALYTGGNGPSASSSAASGSKPNTGGGSWHRGNISKRFDGKEEPAATPPKATPVTIPANNVTKDDEAAAMAAMFQAQTANWEETQEKMSHATRIYTAPRGGAPTRGAKPFSHQPERPLPPSYVCYRCGQKGHWIQDCPTNNDREFDNRPRIKRTTGIPRSFLKAVESPTTGQLGNGVMVTPEGGYVVAQPDSASWKRHVSTKKVLTEADIRERIPSDPSLVCPIDNKLFREAVKTPCCGTVYCEECAQSHLLEKDFKCPSCSTKIPTLDKLIADKPMRTKVKDYILKEIKEGKQDDVRPLPSNQQPGSSSNADETDPQEDQEYYEQQPGVEYDMSQVVAESIPHIQAQLQQISIMLNNPHLPPHVRQQTEMKHHQLQMELQQAQMAATLLQATTAAALQTMQQQQQQQQQQVVTQQMFPMQPPVMQHQQAWTNPYPNQQPAGQDSAYQRLPVNNRRRNLKRDRPSDFLEVGGSEQEAKVPRYWE